MLQILLLKIKNAFNFLIHLTQFIFFNVVRIINNILPTNRLRRKRVIVGFFSMPVLGAVVAFAGSGQKFNAEFASAVSAETILESVPLHISEQSAFSLLPLVRNERIEHGDHLTNVLDRLGVQVDGLIPYLIEHEVGQQLFNHFRAGRYLSVQLDQNKNLLWFRYKLNTMEDHMQAILVEVHGNNQFEVTLEKLNFDKEIAFKSGRIESTLFAAADRAEVSESVAVKMAEIFSSQIDFHRELQKGDEFRVVYEQMTLNGEVVGSGKVLALDFLNNGKQHKAFYFESSDGSYGYYDEQGVRLKTAFLRSPLRFSRISSGFGKRIMGLIMQRQQALRSWQQVMVGCLLWAKKVAMVMWSI